MGSRYKNVLANEVARLIYGMIITSEHSLKATLIITMENVEDLDVPSETPPNAFIPSLKNL